MRTWLGEEGEGEGEGEGGSKNCKFREYILYADNSIHDIHDVMLYIGVCNMPIRLRTFR